jgi:hypothetical protein
VNEKTCATGSLLVVEMFDSERVCLGLADKLTKIEEIEVQKMVLNRC